MGQSDGGRKLFRPIVVNLYGGPGIGKSTMAAGLFSVLKLRGINCELVTEYAKDKVWEESFGVLANQVYVLGKQYHRMAAPARSVDVIVTDSPLLLGIIYGRKSGESRAFFELVRDLHSRFHNKNVLLLRSKNYEETGRMQTRDEAIEIDQEIMDLLDEFDVVYGRYQTTEIAVSQLADEICTALSQSAEEIG